jgi:hypothetical protein
LFSVGAIGILLVTSVLNCIPVQDTRLGFSTQFSILPLKKHGPQTPLPLFEYEAPVPQTPQRKSIEEIARQISALFRGKIKTKKEIYTALADEPYFNGEIDRALTYLKRQKQASFDKDNGIDTQIKISNC